MSPCIETLYIFCVLDLSSIKFYQCLWLVHDLRMLLPPKVSFKAHKPIYGYRCRFIETGAYIHDFMVHSMQIETTNNKQQNYNLYMIYHLLTRLKMYGAMILFSFISTTWVGASSIRCWLPANLIGIVKSEEMEN